METIVHNVTCMGLPVLGFPLTRIDPSVDRQIVFVDFIIHRGVTYASGAYVLLERDGDHEYKLVDAALQPHILRTAS